MAAEDGEEKEWVPPAKIEELYERAAASLAVPVFALNAPTAGARSERPVDKGQASFQLYSLATPNGQKIGILLEELGIDYDAWTINIGTGTQFDRGFVDMNPNSKIPCGRDLAPADGGAPIRLFESGAMMSYLADKHGRFIPFDGRGRAECMNWLMWQMAGQGPITGNFGHFYTYAPSSEVEARNYGVNRYGMEVQRLCSVLDLHLADGRMFICGDAYTIADMAILPWFQILRTDAGYRHYSGIPARDFLTTARYTHACRWADRLLQRPAVQRGMLVCRKHGKPWLVDDRFKHLAKL